MNAKARPAGLLLLVGLFILAFGAPAARGDTGNIIEPQNTPPTKEDGFQAGTCKKEEAATKCSPESEPEEEWFFTRAAGHPPIGFTQYIIKHEDAVAELELEGGGMLPIPVQKIEEPIAGRSIRTLRVDLPPGLTVNPEATPRCPLGGANFEATLGPLHVPNCPDSTIVGREEVTLVVNTPGVLPAPSPPFAPGQTLPVGFVIPPTYELEGLGFPPGLGIGTRPPVYNLEPKAGEPALFGFVAAGSEPVFLEPEVSWESDLHESFRIKLHAPSVLSTLKSRLVNFGQDAGNLEIEPGGEFDTPGEEAGDGTFITTPTTCYDPQEWPHLYSTWFRAESYAEEPNPGFPNGFTPFESKVEEDEGNPIELEECDTVPFDPGISIDPNTGAVDSPSPATVTTTLPFDPETEGGENQSQSHLRSAKVTLPAGMGLNPSAANTVAACTDAQFAKGVRVEDNSCPAASKIGTAEIETPPLPPGSLKGDIYLGEQKSSDPASGEEFRTFVEAKSKPLGIVVRLIVHVSADPNTGQLTAVLDDQLVGPLAGNLPPGLPQAPFESVIMRFDGGTAVLTSPPTCGPNVTTSVMEPWSTAASTATPSDDFTLSNLPGDGPCPQTLAERPFGLGYLAGLRNTVAGSYSTFELGLHRGDGSQEFRRVDVTLPPGMAAKLRGVEYCPETAIAAAVANTGKGELASPSCPDSSLLGTVNIDAGSGPNPFHTPGKVYFAGPYKGAPLSLVFVTPAVAGPFDLGVVVVRTALNVDPETAVVNAVSDPVPYVFGGVKLDVRSIVVSLDRREYTFNSTTCREQMSVDAEVFGGGADPNNPAAWSTVKETHPYRATNCKALRFKPKFYARIMGGKKQTKRTANPKLRTVLKARAGDANLRRAAFILPRATILDQSHIETVCTRVQLAADNCPKAAIYGHARAVSPLLSGRLTGPVYLVSSEHQLPDLLVDLRGQVNIRLRGVISAKNGRLKTVFPSAPDAAVSKFILEMEGGNQGLLINTQNLCNKKRTGFLNLKAQNSRRMRSKQLRINIPACRTHKKG